MSEFDVGIVGASLAGSSLAALLGRRGFSAALIDKDHFPRRKPCGEGLSILGVALLKQVCGGIEELPHLPLKGISIVEQSCHDELRGEFGIALERYNLDHFVQQRAAANASVKLFHSAVRSVTQNNDGFVIPCAEEQICCRYLVLADGNRSLLAQHLNIPCLKTPSRRFGMTAVYQGNFTKEPATVIILLGDGYEAYCTPHANGRMNISLLADKRLVFCHEEIFTEALSRLEREAGFRGEPAGPILSVGPIGATRRRAFHGNVLLAGDCCEQLDPIGGMGMTHALSCAALAAEALESALSGATSVETAFTRYAKKREQAVRSFRGFTMLTYTSLVASRSNPLLRRLRSTKLPQIVSDGVHHKKLLGRTITSVIGALCGSHI